MTTLFLDFNNLAIRTVFSDKDTINNPNPDFNLHRDALLTSIFYNIRNFKPDEVILAVDDENCWRKKIYPEYKEHRKSKKDNDIFPWNSYYSYISEYIEEIKVIFPFVVLKVPYCEADDVVAVLTKHLQNALKIVVTADSDYIQLLDIPNLKLYNPLTQKFITDDNPKLTMEIKIVGGDVGDNIRSIEKRKRGEDPILKTKIGEKTALKLIKTNELVPLLESNEEINNNYKRNRQLVDWGYIPNVLQTKILEMYNSYTIPNSSDLFNFFLKHRLRKQMEDISLTKDLIAPLVRKRYDSEFKSMFCEKE
jgi:5'-3' exonuclease